MRSKWTRGRAVRKYRVLAANQGPCVFRALDSLRLPRESNGTARLCGADDERGRASAEAQVLDRVVAGKKDRERSVRLLREAAHRAFAVAVTLRQVPGGEPETVDILQRMI
jgi:hypothetical protein